MGTLWNLIDEIFLVITQGKDKKFPSFFSHDSFLQSWCQGKLWRIIEVIWEKLHTDGFFFFFSHSMICFKKLQNGAKTASVLLTRTLVINYVWGTCTSFWYRILLTFTNCGLRGLHSQEMVLWGGKGGGRRRPVQVIQIHPTNKLHPEKGHQPQAGLSVPARSQEGFSQGSVLTQHGWSAPSPGAWRCVVSPTEPRRRLWPYIKF